jgi:hypothetical protein
VRWWTVAANRDASSALGWTHFGEIQSFHEYTQAEQAFRRALADNPWSLIAMSGLAQVGTNSARLELVSFSLQRARRLVPGITLEQLRRADSEVSASQPTPSAAGRRADVDSTFRQCWPTPAVIRPGRYNLPVPAAGADFDSPIRALAKPVTPTGRPSPRWPTIQIR